jgi:hypothetical protein
MNSVFLTELTVAGEPITGKLNPKDPNNRTVESWILAMDCVNLPIYNVLEETTEYDLDAYVVIPKGVDQTKFLISKYPDLMQNLKSKFNNIFVIQEGEIGYYSRRSVTEQVWWYSQLYYCDRLYVHNQHDTRYFKGLFPSLDIRVIRTMMSDAAIDKTKLLPKEERAILCGPMTYDYLGFNQAIIAQELGCPIDIPPMGQDRMPKDSYDMAEASGVNYLDYAIWTDWMYNLSKYKYAYMMGAGTAAGSFALNCAYAGVPCIGDNRADTQLLLYPELAVDIYDLQRARELTIKLRDDKNFYSDTVKYANDIYIKEFTSKRLREMLK